MKISFYNLPRPPTMQIYPKLSKKSEKFKTFALLMKHATLALLDPIVNYSDIQL